MTTVLLSRRNLLASAAAFMAPVPARAISRRAAAIDWAMLETALALDVPLVAGTELILYRQFVVEPELLPGIADLGLRGSVNFEVLLRSAPDLILSSPWYTRLEPNLRRIAPVLSMRIHERGRDPYTAAEAVVRELAIRFSCEQRAEQLIQDMTDRIANAARRLAALPPRPVYVISIGDPRHFRVFGNDSMVGAVLKRLGVANAWTGNTSYSVQAPVDIVALAGRPEATIVILSPVPDDARRVLPESAIWRNLPAVRAGRVAVIPPVNHFGGLPAARRLAGLLETALCDGAPGLG